MTACNLIVQRSAGAAYLLTDTAALNAAREVSQFRSKVLGVRIRGKVVGAIAATGHIDVAYVRKPLRQLAPPDFATFWAALPDLLREAMGAHAARHPDRDGSRRAAMLGAVFDRDAGEPRGFMIGSDGSMFPDASYAAFVVHPVLKHLTDFDRLVGRPYPLGTDVTDPRQWQAERDGVRLIEAQRRDAFERADGSAYCGIGGRAMLTRVDASGVSHRVLKNWRGDRVGCELPFIPAATASLVISAEHVLAHARCSASRFH